MKIIMNLIKRVTDSCKEIFGSRHHSVFTWKIALRTVLWVREFEPSLFDPCVYFNIKCIGKLPGRVWAIPGVRVRRVRATKFRLYMVKQNNVLWLNNKPMLTLAYSDIVKEIWPWGYKTWVVQSQTQIKVQWLAACGHVSASSQSFTLYFESENELKLYNLEARWSPPPSGPLV